MGQIRFGLHGYKAAGVVERGIYYRTRKLDSYGLNGREEGNAVFHLKPRRHLG